MCGIAGFVFLDKSKAGPGQGLSLALRNMVGALRHRGPDSEGFFQDAGIGLGMRRLKVIDLATGDQPIFNDDRTCCIVFNGEIYNHRLLRRDLEKRGRHFRTQSDTEVILRLYEEKGARCVEDLNGMYAFAIYDARDQGLFLARDPLGIKPLYVVQDGEKLLFASEIKALLQFPGIPRALDWEATSHFLSLNYLPAPWTLWKGIRQLEGGHCLRIKDGHVHQERFWKIPGPPDGSLSEQEALRKTQTLLRDAVGGQLVADVPVGAFLSGGLDSSSLVALIKEFRTGPVDTFSVGFRERSYDETPYAREVARHFGTRHHEIFLQPEDLPGLLKKLVAQLDQPLADPAAAALYPLSALAREHVTVALSGDGADEIFVGYPTYHANRYLGWYRRLPGWIREGVIAPMAARLPVSMEKFSLDYRAKKFLQGSAFSPAKAHYWWRTVITDSEKIKLFREPFRQAVAPVDSFSTYQRHFADAQAMDFTSQCLYADLRVWLAGNNLHKVDAMSMAHSLEARVPYLDQPLVEFLMRVSPSIKFRGHQAKYLLKRAMAGLLPESILHRRKAGWHLPFAKWFRCESKEFLAKRFEEDSGPFFRIFDHGQVQQILHAHFNGRQNNAFKIWNLLILQEWFEVYSSRVTVEAPTNDQEIARCVLPSST